MTAFTLRQNLLHMQHHFLCNISYVVIALSMGKSLNYTTNHSTRMHDCAAVYCIMHACSNSNCYRSFTCTEAVLIWPGMFLAYTVPCSINRFFKFKLKLVHDICYEH